MRSSESPPKYDGGLNRTIMELKYKMLGVIVVGDNCLNRTIMELKWRIASVTHIYNNVLIVPLWN